MIDYTFPSGASDARNNVRTSGQELALPKGRHTRLHMLGSASFGPATTTATIIYTDGSTHQTIVDMSDWAVTRGDEIAISTTDRVAPWGLHGGAAHIYHYEIALDRNKEVRSVAASLITSITSRYARGNTEISTPGSHSRTVVTPIGEPSGLTRAGSSSAPASRAVSPKISSATSRAITTRDSCSSSASSRCSRPAISSRVCSTARRAAASGRASSRR
ncbi:hypothetical protein ABT294_41850 [Nonomuraea sp. NPDC000554]|uniref:hypothetical protein n=1 Tax=Nonomuraea sp. NPDC000554 TaxID=3154259 RepID=UPI00331D8701